jgi:hypothetical protein
VTSCSGLPLPARPVDHWHTVCCAHAAREAEGLQLGASVRPALDCTVCCATAWCVSAPCPPAPRACGAQGASPGRPCRIRLGPAQQVSCSMHLELSRLANYSTLRGSARRSVNNQTRKRSPCMGVQSITRLRSAAHEHGSSVCSRPEPAAARPEDGTVWCPGVCSILRRRMLGACWVPCSCLL